MRKQVFFIGMVFLIAFVSCKRDHEINPEITKTSDLKVPQHFDWSTTTDISLQVSLPQDGVFPFMSKLSVFQGNPFDGGRMIASGSISPQQPYKQVIRVPSYLEKLFLLLETSRGSQILSEVAITAQVIDFTFSSGSKQTVFKSVAMDPEDGPACDDCDFVISGNDNITITGGKTYCVTDNFTGTVSFENWNNGGTLKVCGTASIANLTITENANVIVTQGGSLTLGSVSMWGGANNSVVVYANSTLKINGGFMTQAHHVQNHGTMEIGGAFTIQNMLEDFVNTGKIIVSGDIESNGMNVKNYGELISGGHYKLNSSSSLTNFDGAVLDVTSYLQFNGGTIVNEGSILVRTSFFDVNTNGFFTNNGHLELLIGDFNVNSGRAPYSVINNGQIFAGGEITFNSGSKLLNSCMMVSKDITTFNSGNFKFVGGYLKSEEAIIINSGVQIHLEDASMLSSKDYVFNSGTIKGVGLPNSVKATGQISMYSEAKMDGAVELATDDLSFPSGGPLTNYFVNGATVVGLDEVTNFIAVGPCNPEGSGTDEGGEPISDSDGDGVPDDQDAFPDDPERAFISWYPNETDFSTVAFEDLWPGMGDFDFNDVVIMQQYQIITNAQNELKEINAKYQLRASGASLNNGFAVALDIRPEYIESVTGIDLAGNAVQLDPIGFEAGHQEQTVLVIIDAIHNMYPSETFINTLPDVPYMETDIIEVKLIVADPQADYGIAPFDPFIFVNQERGKEVHLHGHAPTALVNPEYFGQWEDDSDPGTGKFYQTESNLPWALEIPVRFYYPYEKIDILEVYHKFASWASSGGIEFPDWYLDKPGYRDNSKIYQQP
ncbi:MAG: LruC domain-containing protein [Bacteroidales bacterium]|jgi:LruC domain-containing protein|nr:LruC domain-containing protein [Bacteroidales bacterium]MCK9447698.1 LruC domain-containing protein [Bacteroidales bacterium]MDD3700203.1 LruC domain-containing protein [Bacteroidales bacterium]MDY0370079.1 LruC domain-containing protein [Bacteroidales bacterium]